MKSDVYFVNALEDIELKDVQLNKLVGNGKLLSLLDENLGTENAYKLCNWIDSSNHPYYFIYGKIKTRITDRFGNLSVIYIPIWKD